MEHTEPNPIKLNYNWRTVKNPIRILIRAIDEWNSVNINLTNIEIYLQKDDSRTSACIQTYCFLLFITNFGINFILYCVSGQNFRWVHLACVFQNLKFNVFRFFYRKAVCGMFKKSIYQRQQQEGTQITGNLWHETWTQKVCLKC